MDNETITSHKKIERHDVLTISQEIIDKAREYCSNWRSCIKGNLSHCCKAKEFKFNYLIVEPADVSRTDSCINCVKVGANYVCLCAVRKEIYRKYEM